MSQAALEVAVALYTRFTGDTAAGGVNTLCAGGIHQMEAPQGTNPPYLIFNQHTGVADYTLKVLAQDDMLWMVKAVAVDSSSAAGIDAGRTIAARVDAILTDNEANLTLASKQLLNIRRATDIPPYREDDTELGQTFYHVGALYRIEVTNA